MSPSRHRLVLAGLTAATLAGSGTVAVAAATASSGHPASRVRVTVVREHRDGRDARVVGHRHVLVRPGTVTSSVVRRVRVAVVRERRDGRDARVVAHRLVSATVVTRGGGR